MSNRKYRFTLLVALLVSMASSATQAATATIEQLTGQPVIFEIGEAGARHVSLPVAGRKYELPLEIETGVGDSAVFRLPDSQVAVAPNTVMRIAAPEATSSGLFQRIIQKVGSSLFTVDRQTVEHFQVETPYLVSVVKGTVFNVVVHDDGATVALHEGRLLVTSTDGDRSVNLLPGDVAFSSREGELSKLNRAVSRPSIDRHELTDRGVAFPDEQDGTVINTADLSLTDVGSLVPAAVELVGDDDMIGNAALDTSLIELSNDLDASVGNVGQDVGSVSDDLLSGLTGDAGELAGDVGELADGLGEVADGLLGGVDGAVGDLVEGLIEDPLGDLDVDLGQSGGLDDPLGELDAIEGLDDLAAGEELADIGDLEDLEDLDGLEALNQLRELGGSLF